MNGKKVGKGVFEKNRYAQLMGPVAMINTAHKERVNIESLEGEVRERFVKKHLNSILIIILRVERMIITRTGVLFEQTGIYILDSSCHCITDTLILLITLPFFAQPVSTLSN